MEGNIYKAIPAIMAEIGAIGKDRTNTQQKYSYRGIDDLYNVCQPMMVKHKVFAVPKIINQQREERESKSGGVLIYTILTIEYSFFADDGSFVVATVVGEGMDSGDKSSNKAMAGANKYALMQIFSVPTAELIDSEIESPDPKPKLQKQNSTTVQPEPDRQETINNAQKLNLTDDQRKQMGEDMRACKITGVKLNDVYLKYKKLSDSNNAEDAKLEKTADEIW